MTEKVSRSIAREWWKARVETGGAVDIKELSREAANELGSDPEFRTAFVDDFLESAMYDMGQRILAAQRAALRTTSGLRKQVDEDAQREADKWAQWLEYNPDTGTHIPLPNMSREQVLTAADYRLAQSAKNRYEADWLNLIARQLKPGQYVGDVLDGESLTKLRESMTPTKFRKAA